MTPHPHQETAGTPCTCDACVAERLQGRAQVVKRLLRTRPPQANGDILVSASELEALEDYYPADQRWQTPDEGYRFGHSPHGVTLRVAADRPTSGL